MLLQQEGPAPTSRHVPLLIAMLATLAGVLLALSGCGGSTSEEEDQRVSIPATPASGSVR